MLRSVRFLVYTPTMQFVFPLFVFPFASRVVSFFFDVGVMGVTSRCLTSRDNLIKTKNKVYGYFVSIYSVSSGCWHHCVVCIVCMDYAFLAFVTLHAVRDS